MGNCATNKGPPLADTNATKLPSKNESQYSTIDSRQVIVALEAHMWRHALVTWVLFPLYCMLQAFVPFMQPTCETGFREITLLGVAIYEAHHIYSERKAWYSTVDLLAPPEITVMRHFGALGARRAYFWLGIVASLDLYTDLTFPFVARACDDHLTARWQVTWALVPYIGGIVNVILDNLRFWGVCLSLALINVVFTGFLGIAHMYTHSHETDDDRIGGEVFYEWGLSAETAMMPSVAMLSEEVAEARRYKFASEKDSSAAMEARTKVTYGHTTTREALELELQDHAAEERVARARKIHNVVILIVKVLIGNCMQLWLQSSFYALTFDFMGQEAKVKIIISMVASAVQALIRCKLIMPKLGAIGMLLSAIAVFVVGWSGAKVYYAYKCESHLWNLSSGCVDLVTSSLAPTIATIAPTLAAKMAPTMAPTTVL